MPKDRSDTEAQPRRKRYHMDRNNPMGSPTRRKLSIGDVPGNIRDLAGVQMGHIQIWPNTSIVNTIQQLKDAASQGVGNVQILLDLLDGRNQKMAKVARQGYEELHRCEEANDRGRRLIQWYEFRKKVCE